MRVLMLGWEYPPYMSGGLGTACEGLTKGLAKLGVEILFVIPKVYGAEDAPHMTLYDSYLGRVSGPDPKCLQEIEDPDEDADVNPLIVTHRVPAALKPYWTPEDFKSYVATLPKMALKIDNDDDTAVKEKKKKKGKPAGSKYGKNIFHEVSLYAENCLATLQDEEFDLIHAHDWMTYPAGIALKKATGKPLVVHVHSLEYDRSGKNVDPRIFAIERMGVTFADEVIAVSKYTKSIIHREHNVPLEKIHVVYNGISPKKVIEQYKKDDAHGKVVLFLGRVTFQKGPEYFVETAARVLPYVPDALFVMAGTGDLLTKMMAKVNQLGIQRNFHFAGFLKGREVDRMLSVSDLYIMPSVSEPFGISALEAVNYDTPALISYQSGAAEVLSHALKFDYWDVDTLTDYVINSLLHKELREDLAMYSKQELKKLRWEASARSAIQVYEKMAPHAKIVP